MMAMITRILESVELAFWNIVIPLMTRSNFVRKTVQLGYQVYHDERLKKDIALSLMVSCTGFVIGVAIFSLASLLA